MGGFRLWRIATRGEKLRPLAAHRNLYEVAGESTEKLKKEVEEKLVKGACESKRKDDTQFKVAGLKLICISFDQMLGLVDE